MTLAEGQQPPRGTSSSRHQQSAKEQVNPQKHVSSLCSAMSAHISCSKVSHMAKPNFSVGSVPTAQWEGRVINTYWKIIQSIMAGRPPSYKFTSSERPILATAGSRPLWLRIQVQSEEADRAGEGAAEGV